MSFIRHNIVKFTKILLLSQPEQLRSLCASMDEDLLPKDCPVGVYWKRKLIHTYITHTHIHSVWTHTHTTTHDHTRALMHSISHSPTSPTSEVVFVVGALARVGRVLGHGEVRQRLCVQVSK